MKPQKRWMAALLSFMLMFGFCMGDMQEVQAKKHIAGNAVKKLTLNYTSVEMQKGAKLTLRVTSVSPAGTSKKVTWKSSKKKVVSVSKKGVLTAKKKGTATITAKAKNGGKKLTPSIVKCKVKVTSRKKAKSRVLVAYFSATGTTKGIAKKVAEATGGTLYRITPAKKYSSKDLNYNNDNSRANKEQNNKKARPSIKGKTVNIKDFDTVFIAYPVWHGQAPRIISTFWESYDFSGKTVIPLCTSHSSGIGSSANALKKSCKKNVTWKSGRRFAGDESQSEITKWVKSLGINSGNAKKDNTPKPTDGTTDTPKPTDTPTDKKPDAGPTNPTPNPTESPKPDNKPAGNKILVAYFSCTGTTKKLAEYAAGVSDGNLYEIVPEIPYTSEDLNYGNAGSRATKEQNDSTARPKIQGAVENMGDYKTILLAYPIWWGQAPRIISTFLESYDFSGKIIIPLCTSHSSGIGSSDTNLHGLCSDTTEWKAGRRFAGNESQSEIAEWLNSLGVKENDNAQQGESSGKTYDGIYPQHEPYGMGTGAMPGRVVWSHEPDSVDWDGNGYWWETGHFDEELILGMVNESIASLAGKETPKEGWEVLFRANKASRSMDGGYAAGEKIAIKANINGSAVMDDDTSGRTNMSYTNPVLLKALLRSMVEQAGIKPEDITVYDVSRLFPDYMVEMCNEGILQGVHFVGRNNGVADENVPINWSHEFSGRVNYLPTCVTEAQYMINLANLKGHSYGITLCGKNHFGSFINGNAMRPPEGANLHQWLTKSEMGIYSPLVDLMANTDLGGKTVLYMLDALICAPSEGASITKENSTWQQEPFHGDFTSSIFVSQDPVAIDSVGADFLTNEPAVTGYNSAVRDATNENYLHEAGLIGNAPSGTKYTDGKGNIVKNLGVHEHWNNSSDKQYSRNLGKKEGIELISMKHRKE